ncbi:MAG: hypothetical protein LBS71_03185 [Puniceicoccales bacterium]|nr:hypothetical protein [Puniceicoccales bacterium]
MNTKHLLIKRIGVYYLLAFRIFVFNLEASIYLAIDSPNNFSKIVRRDRQKRHFARDLLGIKTLYPRTPLKVGDELDSGSFGFISECFYREQKFIIKQGRFQDMQKEWENSHNLLKSLTEQLTLDNPSYAKLIGMGSIIPVIAKTEDNSLIQEQVMGWNLYEIIHLRIKPYDEGNMNWLYCYGFPNNLQEAIIRLASLFYGLATLHALGIVHCDLNNPKNIMILNDPDSHYPCRIIDLGSAEKSGNRLPEWLLNYNITLIPPEYRNPAKRLNDVVDQYEKTQHELKRIISLKQIYQSMESSCKIKAFLMNMFYLGQIEVPSKVELAQNTKALTRKGKKLQKKLKELESEEKSLSYPRLQSSYDMFCAARLSLYVLFGNAAYEECNNFKGPKLMKPRHICHLICKLNKLIKEQTDQVYPEYILERFSTLIQRMLSGPNKRPSAMEVFKELQDISLADWEHGNYSIQ